MQPNVYSIMRRLIKQTFLSCQWGPFNPIQTCWIVIALKAGIRYFIVFCPPASAELTINGRFLKIPRKLDGSSPAGDQYTMKGEETNGRKG